MESTRAHLSLQADSNHSSNHDGSHGVPAKRAISEELSCPVCLGEAVFAVETNCSHVFCGESVFFMSGVCVPLKFSKLQPGNFILPLKVFRIIKC